MIDTVIVVEATMSGVDGVVEMMNVSSGSVISSPNMGTPTNITSPLVDPGMNVKSTDTAP